jgi:hypothetical protein
MLDGEIRKDLRAARQSFANTAAHLVECNPDYAVAVDRLARRLAKINTAIDELNLQIPSAQLSRIHLKVDGEIERIRRATATPTRPEPETIDSRYA